jgi:hypothetical protein
MLERIIDARWLEPPEPMELTLDALGCLEQNGQLRLLIHRMPHMLFPILKEWGYSYQTSCSDNGTYEINICHKDQIASIDSPGMP